MSIKRYQSLVYFKNGTHGFEQNLNQELSIEQVVEFFAESSNNLNNVQNSIVFYVNEVKIDEYFNPVFNKKGEKKIKRVYTNKDIEKLFSI